MSQIKVDRPEDAINAASSGEDPLTRTTDDASSAGQALSPSRKRLLELRLRQRVPSNQSMAIPHRAGTGPASASHTQEAIWFLDRWLGPSGVYNSSTAFRLLGSIDRVALENSLQALVDRHPSLRTRFEEREGILVQILDTSASIDLQVLDLARGSGAESSRELQQILAEHGESAFNLGQAPLLRAKLFRLSPREHVLLLVIHHIVSDGWSREIMLRELSALYTDHMEGSKSTLPSLPIDFADYAIWQRDGLSGSNLDRQLGYWRDKLAALPTLELPTDFPRPPIQSYRGARLHHPLPATVVQGLKALGQSAGTTLFMTALAAFKMLLYRYGAGSDIVLGTPIAGRGRIELEGLIGFFANTLVLRTDLSGAPSFRALLGRVRDTALGAYSHQDLPFEKLVEALAPERDASRNPLFQVCFVLETASEATLRLPGITVEPVQLPTQHAKFDLTLSLREQDGALQASFEYCTDLFSEATIQRMAEHFQVLLQSILANPDQSIDTLDLLSEPERLQLLRDFNQTRADYPGPQTLQERFALQVRRTPQSVALIDQHGSLTYQELNQQSNQLAHFLVQQGVHNETLVGISMRRERMTVVAILAILKAGGAYVPLDPDYPSDRLTFMVEDAGIRILLTQEALHAHLPKSVERIVSVDGDRTAIAQCPNTELSKSNRPDDLAYVIYTSGSTGKPKGVAITHRSICNHLSWMTSHLGLTASDRILLHTSISFDASVWEMLAPLHIGACSFLAEPGGERDPAYLAAAIRDHALTIAQHVPASLAALLDEPALGQCQHLRYVVCGGEPLTHSLARRCMQTLPWVTLGNFYGPSEATIDATSLTLTESPGGDGIVPIGKPIANARCHILDAHRQPVPIGVVGELYIGGAGLARGYHNRAALTEERFVTDPFIPGERLYRTGDLARYLPDGCIAFAGRNDHQIKLRGMRIELGEIEAVLNDCPGVSRCAVIVREDQPGVQRLVAYVVGANAPSERLFEPLKARLPAYMVPAAIMPLEALPLLPNGKLDRRALPAPGALHGAQALGHVAPRTAFEALVAEVWADLLGAQRTGIHDDFFQLGGHSLLAGRLAGRLSRLSGVQLPLRQIFESPTIAGLAQAIDRLRESGAPASHGSITPVARSATQPLSFAQQRLWFIEQFGTDGTTYSIPMAIRLHGALNVEALRFALDALVARHESLRTTFASIDGQAHQVIGPVQPVALNFIDHAELAEEQREARTLELVRHEAARPFDLACGPLMRVALVRLAERMHVLLINMHHIISDGWSAEVFDRELSALYSARLDGRDITLPALPVQYADYAIWQREWLSGSNLEQQLGYWQDKLAALPTLDLPTDHPRPPLQSYRGARLNHPLPATVVQGLKALGQSAGTTLFMTALAAFKVLLYRYGAGSDIVLGTPIAGRGRIELEGLIGFFANTLVLRTDLSGAPSFRALLARVRDTALGGYSHQDLPFEKLVEALAPERDASRNPLFQVCFIFQTESGATLRLPGITVEPMSLPTWHAKFDLTLSLREQDGALQASFEYCTDLFNEATIQRMAGHFQVLLQSILANPDQSIDTLDLMSSAERQHILFDWNNTATRYDEAHTLQRLFEAQVKRTPTAIALIDAEQTLTYAQLNARANQLAHFLINRAIGPDTFVAVCMERSATLIVAILGILKSGAAYVPFDPELPTERSAFILQDCAAHLVLTQVSLIERLPQGVGQHLSLDRDWGRIEHHPIDNPPDSGTAQRLAYVMYTSGSMGRPKGVAIRQQGILRLVIDPDYVTITPADTIAQVSNIAFDAATFEIWGALLNGARLVILQRDVILSPPEFVAAVQAHHISCMFLTTALFNRMSIDAPDAFRELRYVLFGGETCDPDRVKAVMQAGPPANLVHVYGPTETTTFATYHVIRTAEVGVTIPIGRPINGTEILLMDQHRQLVPPGVIGEICIGGPGVAAGYINLPDETRARFVTHPFRTNGADHVYRTGDLARIRDNGSLEYVGRDDDQVKIRGFRIEPSEISAVLGTCPLVRACHVATYRQERGERALVAYVVANDADRRSASSATLRQFLAARLPAYMVPSAYVAIDEIPVTPSGKIDRRALPAPTTDRTRDVTTYVAPRDVTEQTMCRVWAEVLGVERVGLDDNFFEIGGHSLLAAKLFARLDEAFEHRLTLGVLFTAPSVRLLAEHYRNPPSTQSGETSSLVALRSRGTLPAFYAVPGVFGNVVGFADLVRALGPEQPIYGFQSLGLDGLVAPLESIEAIASQHIRDLRAHQPDGPYALVGACFGATVAYEMARQLMADGKHVAILALLDPTAREGDAAGSPTMEASRHLQRTTAWFALVKDRLALYCNEMRGLSVLEVLNFLAHKTRSLGGSLVKQNALKGVQRELNQREVYRANVRALDRYDRRPLRGKLGTLEILETARSGETTQIRKIEWQSHWNGTIVRHPMPGKDSGDMITGANARIVAKFLSECMRRAFDETSVRWRETADENRE
ncbi:MAG: amino acid adenylation domain-containing protein [Burkholderiales bacterium]